MKCAKCFHVWSVQVLAECLCDFMCLRCVFLWGSHPSGDWSLRSPMRPQSQAMSGVAHLLGVAEHCSISILWMICLIDLACMRSPEAFYSPAKCGWILSPITSWNPVQCWLKVLEVRAGPTLIWQSLTCSQQNAPIQWLLQLKLATERSMQPLLGQQAGLRETLDLLKLHMLAISCYYSCASSWFRFLHGLGCLQFFFAFFMSILSCYASMHIRWSDHAACFSTWQSCWH